ncbi:unnamed protein product [Somion occarium]|uniref:F-box domain-containing protein n=1 Tax=Somion occarium TaxID=3059160 RepID=A0ABP1DV69_9APHY
MIALATYEEGNILETRKSLEVLPYDLLLNITQNLTIQDVCALQLTCKSLYDFSVTRPVYRHLALCLLRRCRALPLTGFQCLSDLSTEQLISAVKKATRLELDWLQRTPRRCFNSAYATRNDATPNWYTIINAPADEEIDWLSPVTTDYTLCATKSGKVICWDIRANTCTAQWDPGNSWELWKCRVQFDTRTVYFTMAKLLSKFRTMEFILMKLEFPSEACSSKESAQPVFTKLTTFRTAGSVINIFLLDPSSRLLSAFIWLPTSKSIGLFVLPDWDLPEYVFVDTTVECASHANWSCILYKDHVVVHTEDSEMAVQHFYPLPILKRHAQPVENEKMFTPRVSGQLPPISSVSARFVFPSPVPPAGDVKSDASSFAHSDHAIDIPSIETSVPNPFPPSTWLPDSAHFVRQWWPTLPIVPKLSCTVILFADHDQETHKTKYVLAQHYFRVPLTGGLPRTQPPSPVATLHVAPRNQAGQADDHSDGSWHSGASSASTLIDDSTDVGNKLDETEEQEASIRVWYVSEPFEVACTFDLEETDEGTIGVHPRPLMAVDFGHACWVEYMRDQELDENEAAEPFREKRRLRLVSFPPIIYDEDEALGKESFLKKKSNETEGVVRTLEIPHELDLDKADTLNIEQSHGTVIISTKDGKIFILCYE